MSQRTSKSTWIYVLALTLVLIVNACGRRSPSPSSEPEAELEVTSVEATSQSSVKVAFNAPVGEGADVPGNYHIETAGGSTLAVLAAYPNAGERTVNLATEAQEAGYTYYLEVSGVKAADGQEGTIQTARSAFGGSSERAPIVASAIALSNTEILVTFAFPSSGQPMDMSDSALNTGYYDIIDPDPKYDKTPSLEIEDIEWAESEGPGQGQGGRDQSRIIITTEPQEDKLYTLKVTNVTARAGDKLIDPDHSSVTFNGIPVEGVAPKVTGAVATSNTSVLVSFSQPMTRDANDARLYTISYDDELVGGAGTLQVEAAELRAYNTQVELTTEPMFDERIVYTLVVDENLESRLEKKMDTDERGDGSGLQYNQAQFEGIRRDGPIDGDDTPPRVTNVGALSNTTVRVTFSKPVRKEDAEKPENYRIIGESALGQGELEIQRATLRVHEAIFDDVSRTAVTLTTDSQSDIEYVVAVTDIKDLAGNQIAPPESGVDNPSQVIFFGIPPSGEVIDSSCDGLPDHIQVRGWVVRVTLADGTVEEREVTADPGNPNEDCNHPDNIAARDTNQDGVSDYDKWKYRLDPRSADTDGDGLTDFEELYIYGTDPTKQDTDGDGISDYDEVAKLRTSPTRADSTGDGFSDGEAAGLQNRDPLVANLPDFDIEVVGDVHLGLDVTYSAQSSSGSRFLEQRSSSTSLTSERSLTLSRSNATTTEWFIKAGGRFQVGYDSGFTFEAEASVEGGYSESTTVSFGSESVIATQREQASSMTTDEEMTEEETLVREVVGASMASAIDITNRSDIAFTISNIEITAKIRDPRDLSRFVPVATLVGESSSVNIGPAPFTRGPLRFTAVDVSAALVEELRRNPQGLVFRVVNYDITDEFGRNFAYTFQDVNDRTATIMIDYAGFEEVEVPRVATSIPPDLDEIRKALEGPFADYRNDENFGLDDLMAALDGLPNASNGITMQEAFEDILGLEHVPFDDQGGLTDAERRNSYTTDKDGNLWRVRTVESDDDAGLRWFVEVPRGASADHFNDISLRSGQLFKLMFGQDLDGDGLTLQEELLYGSIDSDLNLFDNDCFGTVPYPEVDCGRGTDSVPDSRDTPKIGIDDDEQVYGRFSYDLIDDQMKRGIPNNYQPWRVFVGGQAYTTNANPGRIDTSGNGLTDCQELGRCPIHVYLFPADAEPGDPPLDASYQSDVGYQSNVTTGQPFPKLIIDDNGIEFEQDELGRVYGNIKPGLWRGEDGLGIPAEHPGQEPLWTIQLDADANPPTITDPRLQDTDGDGLTDYEELVGFTYQPLESPNDYPRVVLPPFVRRDAAGNVTAVFDFATNPLRTDTDGDGIADGDEVRIGIDPTVPDAEKVRDSSGDGLSDWQSRQGWRVAFIALEAVDPQSASGAPPEKHEMGPVQGELIVCEPGFDDVNAEYPDSDYADCRIIPMDDVDNIDEIRSVPDSRSPRRWRFSPSIDEVLENLNVGWDSLEVYTRNGQPLLNTTADPRAFDTSGNGLSDYEEFLLGTHPRLADTSGDGLSDYEEVQGLDFPEDADNPIRYTDPLNADTDGDGLTDYQEVREPWVVDVAGEEPYKVYSDPLDPDRDNDGLTDFWERHYGTDPNNWDTDGDRASDFVEISGAREGVETDPLAADQVVIVTYTNATLINSCFRRLEAEVDGTLISVSSDYAGNLLLERPNGTVVQLAHVGPLSDLGQGETHHFVGASHGFALARSEGFRVFSSTITEEIKADIDFLEIGLDVAFIEYGNYTRGYSYPADGGSFSEQLTGTLETDDGNIVCEISVSWTVRVVD